MFKGRAGDLLLLALTDENVRRLKGGEPIDFALSELGFASPMRCQIFYTGPKAALAGREQNGTVFFMGFNDKGLAHLMAGNTMQLPPEVAGPLTRGAVSAVWIFYGRHEQEIKDWLTAEGIIGELTQQIIDPRLNIH